PDTDALLVRAYRAGDERAATGLVARHAASLGRYLYSSGAGPDEIDDYVQEAFFRAFSRLETWRGDASFRSWLFTIAGNLLKDEFRRRKGRRMISIDSRHDLAGSSDPAGELAVGDAETVIRRGLATLPRLQREVFLLRVEGAEYADIAVALGTTPGAARVHYHHAVRTLKELLR
ncbi:MAG: RNA polymerase sigma factor, partial [Gemmatimonadales bacterium]|nr:RNA polymerase sigma factor [Gemmatimonadales bacterium]